MNDRDVERSKNVVSEAVSAIARRTADRQFARRLFALTAKTERRSIA